MPRFFTIEDLEKYSPDHSLLECVECGRWMDIGKKGKEEWKFEKDMDSNELNVVTETLEDAKRGKGRSYSTCQYCKEKYVLTQSSCGFNWYRFAKKCNHQPLNAKERQEVKAKFGEDLECSFAKDKDGYFCYTHRARSESYPSISKIPKSKVEFIGSTG